MSQDIVEDILYLLEELGDDDSVPRNVKAKVKDVMRILNSGDELSIRKDKALHEMEALNDDSNLQSHTRSQIWDILSQLERL